MKIRENIWLTGSIIYRVTRWPLHSDDYLRFTSTLNEQISITEFLISKGMPHLCNLLQNMHSAFLRDFFFIENVVISAHSNLVFFR